jgi:hypothetical protein
MATILENMERRRQELAADPQQTVDNVTAAIAAMHEGIQSGAWAAYMTQFATDENGSLDSGQLARLTGEDGTLGDSDLNQKRCYMIGNSLCAMTTNDRMLYGVKSIDDGVGGQVCDRKWSECPQ